ncbi:MAG: asparaginase [Acidimicrobiia bacterium]|nr:MAG: asparaginase [Acidimicrobiia bacterium]
MRLARVRSGLAESFDDVAAIALDADGTVLFASGAIGRQMFYRSVIKPFQAIAAARTGLTLPPVHLAVACSSHGGYPVHLAIVEQILKDYGLATDDLGCTPDHPLAQDAHVLQIQRGNSSREPRFHNCSGKHAGWLAACTVAGWDTRSYLDLHHPLQRSILDVMKEYSGVDARPVGVDGCGAPTLRGTVATLATAFSKLTTESEAEPIAMAMTTYGALVADNIRADGRVGVTWGGPQKVGAEGSFAMARHGVAIATKSESGSSAMAVAAALEVANRVGMLPAGMEEGLSEQLAPPVFGAGRQVGRTTVVDPS